MFLEKIGKFCFSRLSAPVFFFLMISPILFSAVLCFFKSQELRQIENEFHLSFQKAKTALERQKTKDRFLKRYSHPSPYFLSEKIESLSFLETEKKALEKLLNHPAIVDKRLIQERLKMISGNANKLVFVEESVKTKNTIKETEEIQKHPIETDVENLKTLLSWIEDIPLEETNFTEPRPQMMITEFDLRKKKTILDMDTIEIEMKILNREFGI